MSIIAARSKWMKMEMQKHARTTTLSLDPKQLAKRMLAATLSTAVLLFAIFWSQNLWAADKNAHLNEDPIVQQEAAQFIQQLANKALTSLSREDYTLPDLENRFRKILVEGFDVTYIGKISLGRHKKKATSQHLKDYYALFPEYLVKIYTSRLTKLDTREVRVGKVLPKGKRDMYVRTKVIDSEQKTYDVDWRVRPVKKDVNEGQSYKIIDVKIEGISMARTQRDDFAARISESGMTGLINFMQAIINGEIKVEEVTKEKTARKQAH